MKNKALRWMGMALGIWLVGGCGGGSGGGGLSNKDPGANDLNVVVAFGDSLTQGNMCACSSYPDRLAGLIAKTVVNTGVGGTIAQFNVDRAQTAIDRFHPAFMLILYGVGDVIHGFGTSSILDALRQMVSICRTNHVVPALATYPIPFGDHGAFAGGTRALNRGIRALASELSVPCVDLAVEFEGTTDPVTETSDTDPALMVADGLHPNDAGTQIMALAFADLF